MSAWARIIPSLPPPMGASDSSRGPAEPSYRSFRPRIIRPKRPQSKRRERNEGAPAGIAPNRRVRGSRLLRPSSDPDSRGGGMPPPFVVSGSNGPHGSEQDDVSRPH